MVMDSISKVNADQPCPRRVIKARKSCPLVRVIQTSPPTLVKAEPENFRSVVQQLTGPSKRAADHEYLDSDNIDPHDNHKEPILQKRRLEEDEETIIDMISDLSDHQVRAHYAASSTSDTSLLSSPDEAYYDDLDELIDHPEAQIISQAEQQPLNPDHESSSYHPLRWDFTNLEDLFDAVDEHLLPAPMLSWWDCH